MELTNEQRKYLGLELIEPNWGRVEIPNNCVKPERSTGKDIFFGFCGCFMYGARRTLGV